MNLIRRAKNAYIAISIVMILLGLLLVIWPEISLSMFCYMIGIVLVVAGVIKLFGYFSKDLYRLAFQFDLAFGIVSILMGAVFIAHPEHILAIVPTIMGVVILADGAFKIQTACDAKRFGLSTWWMIVVLAVLTSCCGLLLIFKPFEGAIAMMILLGVTLLVDGIQNLWVAIYTVKACKEHVIDIDDYREL